MVPPVRSTMQASGRSSFGQRDFSTDYFCRKDGMEMKITFDAANAAYWEAHILRY